MKVGTKKRKAYTYDLHPNGTGKLKCEICGLPYANHKLGPACPFAIEGELQHKPSGNYIRSDR